MKFEKQSHYLQEEKEYICEGISEEAILSERVFCKGDGVYLEDMDENRYMDFSSGIFTNILGTSHPYLVKEVQSQVSRLWNVHDFATPQRLYLAKALKKVLPSTMERFYFCTTGAEAVEAAIRAVSCYVEPMRKNIGALRYGFHGKTLGSRMLVNWQVGNFYSASNAIQGFAAYCYRCPFEMKYPGCNMLCAKMTVKQVASKSSMGGFVFELIQGATGIIVPPKEYWEILQDSCKKNKVLMVADEVMTGGGKLGVYTASEYFHLEPDLMTLSKGVSNGIPFALLAGRKEIMNSLEFRQPGSTSSTYASNPLGISASLATLKILEEEKILESLKHKARIMKERLYKIQEISPLIGDIRGIGLLYALEFVKDKNTKIAYPDAARKLFTLCMNHGLKVCLGGAIIRICPPLNITEDELKIGLDILENAARELK